MDPKKLQVPPLPSPENTQDSIKLRCSYCGKMKGEEGYGSDRYHCLECLAAIERVKNAEKQDEDKATLEHLYGGQMIHTLTLETFKNLPGKEEAFQAIRDYHGENLYIWGGCGKGKSHLAAALINSWLKDNALEGLCYETPTTLNRKMRKLDPETEQARLNEYINARLLVLDDLGFKRDSEFSQSLIIEILDGRYKKIKRGCVITSNLDLDALGKLYDDDRIPSRLSGFRVIEVKGDDMRLMGAK